MSELVRVEVRGLMYDMSEEDAMLVRQKQEQLELLDKLQYNLKILMNSSYGALSNPHFRYFDPRLGNSTTGTGRFILLHMVRVAAEYFDGAYEYPSPSIIAGDTDSCYVSCKLGKTTDDVVKIADEFATHLNNTFEKFMQDTHLCRGEYAKRIKAVREVVADRAIFVDKKMYMMHLVDKKGKRTDEMKVMGLMVKKTTIPKLIRARIIKLFEQYLKGIMGWPEFTTAVIELRHQLINTDEIKLIGSPKTIKNIGNHEKLIDAIAAKKAIGKNVPGHVRAGLLYNMALKRFGDKESPPMTSGTKIRSYKLLLPEHGSNSIAIPTDIDPIPQWFKDEYLPKINVNAQLESIFVAPIQQILTAIGRRVPTENDLVAEECLEF